MYLYVANGYGGPHQLQLQITSRHTGLLNWKYCFFSSLHRMLIIYRQASSIVSLVTIINELQDSVFFSTIHHVRSSFCLLE